MVSMLRDLILVVCSAPYTLNMTCLRSWCLRYLFCKMRTRASRWEGKRCVVLSWKTMRNIVDPAGMSGLCFETGALSKQILPSWLCSDTLHSDHITHQAL